MSKPNIKRHTTFMDVVRTLFSGAKDAHGREIEMLLSPQQFEETLMKERARADRGGQPFALLTFDINLPHDREEYMQAVWFLASLLNARTRITDTKGWFGDRVGLLCPDTPIANVSIICDLIEENFNKHLREEMGSDGDAPQITYQVYAYPGSILPGRPGPQMPPGDSNLGASDTPDK